VTQRGNYRQKVFARQDDYEQYREWLALYARKHGLEIWAYCLMPNHVHLVCVPTTEDAIALTLRTLHMQYAQYFNRQRRAVGHLWQGRYFSCVLDEAHVHAAVRYVELNAVRGGLAKEAWRYPWSSARCHVTGQADPILWGDNHLLDEIGNWKEFLSEAEDPHAKRDIIDATRKGYPCGDGDFLRRMEEILDRRFTDLRPGRPKKMATK